jgi:flagellar capping protein FliD
MSKVIELRLKIDTYKKKIEQAEAELELLYHQLDEEMENSLVK